MQKLIYCLVLFFGWQAASAQTESLFRAAIYKNGVDSLPYRLLYPVDYEAHKSYPLVLFLHGGGERGNDNLKQLTHGISIFTKDESRNAFPCFLIIPQCPREDYWASASIDRSVYPLKISFDYSKPITKSLNMALDIVKNLRNTLNVDESRIYITGLSMGGMGSLEAVYREPGIFAAAAVICGGGDASAYGQRQINTAFWLFHGDEDIVVKAQYSREMYERLRASRADVRFTEYIGVNHNSWDQAYSEPGLLPWLFGHVRNN